MSVIVGILVWSTVLLGQVSESGKDRGKDQSSLQTWKGTLLDSGCKEVRDSTDTDVTLPPSAGQPKRQDEKKTKDPVKSLTLTKRSFENCQLKPNTAAFAIMSDGKIFKFDEAGNTEIANRLKSNEKIKELMESGRNKAVLVTITGSVDKNVIHLSSISFTDQ